MKRHWYRIFIRECMVCGKTETWRERVYGRKPKTGTHDYEQQFCGWCLL